MSYSRHTAAARRRRTVLVAGTILVSIALGATAVQAIPSPELIVGSLSSLSQLVALVSATLGGGAVLAGSSVASAAQGRKAASPWPRRLALVLIAVAAASLGLNAWLIAKSYSEQRARLEAALVRPTPKSGGQALDPMLKEIPYGEQVRHPLGMATEEAAGIVADVAAGGRDDWVLLDIRETPETEMGSLPKALKIRFPDLAQSKLDLAHRKALLFCHNGNRSAETCAALAEKGIDCRFIVGGLEKWLVEGRRLSGSQARTIDDLRAIPDYPNRDRLLDTAEAQRLVGTEGAVLVDVRYPGEFAAGHLAGAINLPIRPTPTAELKRRLSELPRKPVVAPCYDRRSCFFAEILGLELSRAGGDFRGRYTLPWEMYTPSRRPPHVERWLETAQIGLWDKARAKLAEILVGLASIAGLPLALVALAAASRLIVLPFAVKSERDQMESRRMEGEVRRLKQSLAADPGRLGRALRELFARHGLTPGRNLLALAFLPVLAICVSAAGDAAVRAPESLGWIADIAERDTLLILPAVFGTLVGLYVQWSMARTGWHRLIIWLAVAPLLALAAALLPAAAGIYMVASALLLLVQRAFVTGTVERAMNRLATAARRRFGRKLPHPGIVTLADTDRLATAGNKALRLARLRAAGFPVPDGVVLTSAFLAAWPGLATRDRQRITAALWKRLGSRSLAVRSSGQGEDGAGQSFAGVFESVLDVDRAGLEEAIDRVLVSFAAQRAAAYQGNAGEANILLQPMVAAEHAGVLFTEDPETPGLVLVELVEGNAEKLVSGRAAPRSFRFGRLTRRLRTKEAPPVALEPLVAMALEVEALFGAPQDIEWARGKRGFILLQSRDITTPANADGAREEWRRLVAIAANGPVEGPILAQNEMAEMLPRPTPVSLSLLEAMWGSGGSVDRAARSLGIDYRVGEWSPTYHVTAFGRLYVDKRQERARAPRLSSTAVRRILARTHDIEVSFRETFLPAFLAEMRLVEATDLDRLPTVELVDTFRRQVDSYIEATHVEVDVVNILARFHLDRARGEVGALGHDAAELLADLPMPAAAQSLQLASVAPAPWREFQLREALGHRAVLDYELAVPRFGDAPETLETAAARARDALWGGAVGRAAAAASIERLPARARGAVETARRLQVLKEDAKHHTLRQVAVLRRLVLALDTRFALGGLAFHLTIDELKGITLRNARDLARIAGERKAAADMLKGAPMLAPELSAADIESCGRAGQDGGAARPPLVGTRVAGSRPAHGRAVVVSAEDAEAGAAIDGFRDGDILVCPFVHPAWLGEVVRAGGVVSGIGGWLSHMAIVAREHDVTMIVGATGLEAIANSSVVTLHLDGRIELHARPAVRAETLDEAAE